MCFYWNGKTICTLGIGVWLLSKTRLFDWWDNTLMFRGRRSSQVVLDSLCTCWSISHGFIWVLHYCAMKWKVNLLSSLWGEFCEFTTCELTTSEGQILWENIFFLNICQLIFPPVIHFFSSSIYKLSIKQTQTQFIPGKKIIYILKYSKNIKVYIRKIIQNFEIK